MPSTVSYQVGAVFLLCACLMYGTLSGFFPRVLRGGKAAPLLIGLVLLGFVVYRFAPATVNNTVAPAVPASPRPAPKPAPVVTHARTPKRPAPQVRAKMIDQAVPVAPPAAVKPEPVTPPPIAPVLPSPEPSPSAAPTPSEDRASPRPADLSGDDDPYDSGLKRGIKRLGRFLHLVRKKETQQ